MSGTLVQLGLLSDELKSAEVVVVQVVDALQDCLNVTKGFMELRGCRNCVAVSDVVGLHPCKQLLDIRIGFVQ